MRRERRCFYGYRMLLIGTMLILAISVSLQGRDIRGTGERLRSYDDYKLLVDALDPVNIDEVPEGAYYKGKIQIKIREEIAHIIKDELLRVDAGFVITGVKAIDALNEKYGITEYRPLLHNLYEECERSAAQRERHREWKFHLWFDLSFDKSSEPVEIVHEFRSLEEIAVAEPLYIKEIIEPVEVIEIDNEGPGGTRFTPNDPLYAANQWALNNTGQRIQGYTGTAGRDIRAEAAWEIEKGHPDVIVTVFDNGMRYNHVDLQGNVWPGIGPQGTNTPGNDHGTHVAGTIAAVTNNNRGVAGIAGGSGTIDEDGMADGVRVMACNIFNTTVSYTSRKIYATENGAAISQNSWGYREANVYNQADINAINYFNANAGGDVLDGGITIFAAGNDNTQDRRYPAYYSGTMAVASTFNRDQKSGFSNYGEWVDISAPGSLIPSTVGASSYVWMSGTSMACPHVSGVAALVVSHAHRNGVLLTNEELAAILLETTDDIYQYNHQRFQGLLGTGRVNAHSALVELQNVYMGVRNPRSFNAEATADSTITLTWRLNEDNNPVVIVWSRNPIPGRAENGEEYDTGDDFPGGGEVLYTGRDTTYIHQHLDAGRTFYYKAFSFDEELDYSVGYTANETTLAPTFEIPFYQDFDDEDVLPAMWQTVDLIGNGQVWQIGTFEGGLEETSGNYVFINSRFYDPEDRQNTQIMSPIINLLEAESVTLRFKHYFEAAPNSNGTLFYSINGGASWQFLEIFNTTTDNPQTFEKIIPALAGVSNARIRWGFFGQHARHWCIDNIEIFETVFFPPVNLSATANDSLITIEWQPPYQTDSLRYNVYRNGEIMNEIALSDTIYVDRQVEKDVLYEYYVTSVYPRGESTSSEIVQVIIEDDEEPIKVNPPRNLSFTTEGYDVYLNWEMPEDMKQDSLLSFRVFRNHLIINMEPVTDTTYIDKEVEPEISYTYFVTTLYGDEESEPSDSVNVKLLHTEEQAIRPVNYLAANYPNPFNPQTTIRFSLAKEEQAVLEIFDIRGRLVTTPIEGIMPQGNHTVVWDGTNNRGKAVGSGIYFYRLKTGSFVSTKKMILMK